MGRGRGLSRWVVMGLGVYDHDHVEFGSFGVWAPCRLEFEQSMVKGDTSASVTFALGVFWKKDRPNENSRLRRYVPGA